MLEKLPPWSSLSTWGSCFGLWAGPPARPRTMLPIPLPTWPGVTSATVLTLAPAAWTLVASQQMPPTAGAAVLRVFVPSTNRDAI